MNMVRPLIELVVGVRRYGVRIAIANFRFELGALIGGFTYCDNYTEEEIIDAHRQEIVKQVAEEQALSS